MFVSNSIQGFRYAILPDDLVVAMDKLMLQNLITSHAKDTQFTRGQIQVHFESERI